jgi:deoxyribonuclease IV
MAAKARVLSVLSDSDFSTKLYHKLPKKCIKLPEDIPKHHYPTSFIKLLPKTYCDLGVITEYLLRKDITTETLKTITQQICQIDIPDKVLKLKTVQRYLTSVKNTKELLLTHIGNETILYDTTVTRENCQIEGHPDVLTDTHVFEIKTSGKIKDSWKSFLLQVFTYAALHDSIKTLHLVFPLQEYIWTFEITESSWPKKKEFIDLLLSYAKPSEESFELSQDFAYSLLKEYPIGSHISKSKTIHGSLLNLDYQRPYQLFLTRAVALSITEMDIQITKDYLKSHNINLYVHAPYLLNLCIEPHTENDYVVQCLQKHMEISAASGIKGVVVHVGKYCDKEKSVALENMRTNIKRILEKTKPECPLLLETPAGQGSELLTSYQEFMEFMDSFQDDRFGMCLDTCHVFANGDQPYDYLKTILENPNWKKYLKLIHFNDSKPDFNSKVDRHAFIGFGKIPQEQLLSIAQTAFENNIPMLTE